MYAGAKPVNAYDYYDDEDEFNDEGSSSNKKKYYLCGACSCSCCCCLLVLYVLIGFIGGKFFVETPVGWGWMEALTACGTYWCGPGMGPLLSPNNFTMYLRWQGVEPAIGLKTNASLSAQTCYSPQQAFDMADYNADAPWKQVAFLARADPEAKAEQATINAWAMKTPKDTSASKPAGVTVWPPRIVVQHGVGSSQNNRYAQYAAYQLRSMGFDVLTPSFRNHGWSSATKHDRTTWGWIYPMDLLGAWDYAVNDPDGVFGGAIDPKYVGILGISLGAMTTATAFGMEQKVHAAFIDSGPSDPKDELKQQISMLGPLADILLPALWEGANWWSGVDLGRYIPSKALPCTTSPTVRPVAVASSAEDTFVPLNQAQQLVKWIATSPNCYTLTQVYFPAVSCGGMDHAQEMYLAPDEYRLRLCKFFTDAFGMTCNDCGLELLPWYNVAVTERSAKIDSICKA
jgi:pimeloyl-ACP methyl ester carboxylesterase